MKLNNQQITVLANIVLEKLKSKEKVTENEKKVAENHIKELEKLESQIEELEKKKSKLVKETESKLGYRIGIWDDTVKKILINKPTNLPSSDTIKNKIILESIFETKESLQEFIDNLVKEYSK